MPRFSASLFAAFGMLVSLPDMAAAQKRAPPDQADQTSVTIDAKVGGKRYQASGKGECKHAPDASMDDVSASLWMVQYASAKDGKIRQLKLTLWRPKDGGPDRLSLSLQTSAGSYRIEEGAKGESAGSATVTVLPSGPGGRLEITGKEAGGKPIQVTIECSAFTDGKSEGE